MTIGIAPTSQLALPFRPGAPTPSADPRPQPLSPPYSVLLADPPWHYNDRYNIHGTRFGGGAGTQYALLRDEDLAELPIARLAARDAVLFLWTTGPKLAEGAAARVLAGWGFRGKTIAFDWEKTTASGKPWYGPGFYTGSNAEYVLLATRGEVLRPAERPPQIVRAPHPRRGGRIVHSGKPDEVLRRIDLMFPGPKKLELFARERAAGWDATGLELDGRDVRELLAAPLSGE